MARKSTKTSSAPLLLEGALDIQNAATQHAQLAERLAKAAPVVTIDLAQVTACDSAGLQLLCAARRSTLSTGREWRLVNPSEPVLRACTEIALPPEHIGL